MEFGIRNNSSKRSSGAWSNAVLNSMRCTHARDFFLAPLRTASAHARTEIKDR